MFLLIVCGLIGATVSGILIGITKKYKVIGVVGFTLGILCWTWFTEVCVILYNLITKLCYIQVAHIENQPYLVAIPLCVFGIFAFSLLPICMELGVEVTYPVAEATSSGLLWSSAYVMSIIVFSFENTFL